MQSGEVEFYTDTEDDILAAIKHQTASVSKEEDKDTKDKDKKQTSRSAQSDDSDDEYDDKEALERFFRSQEEENGNPNYLEGEDDGEDDEEGDESEEEEEEGQGQSKSSDQEEDEDDLIQILRQENLLYIPEDFDGDLDEETLERFKQETRARQEQEIIEGMRQRFASDPNKLEQLDYFLTGDVDADLPFFSELQDYLEVYENYDVKDEAAQRAILSDWLRDGLDPNNPAHKMRLDKVDAEVEEILNNFQGETKAEEARQFFVSKFNELKEEEIARVNQAQQYRQQQEAQRQQSAMKWHHSFQEKVESQPWSPVKKRAILEEQYGQVTLTDGRRVPKWYAKEMMIKGNPELYSVYLDWLNRSFDLQTGKFTGTPNDSVQRAANRKILEIANKKGAGKRRGGSSTVPSGPKTTPQRKLTQDDLLY